MKKLAALIIFILVPYILYSQSNDTITTSSGLKYIVKKVGKGKQAVKGKAVEVHYTGMLLDGKKFDSSLDRGEPIEFTLGTERIIKGWNEGIALMKVGGEMRLIIPPDLAYGERGSGDVIPPNSTLVFDVKLISVNHPKIPIIDTMLVVIFEKTVKKAIEVYYDIKDNDDDERYNFKESQLNMLGYQLLQGERNNDAIEIFKLNVKEYPKSFNVYDSLGEAYMVDGQVDLAVKNYEKSLKLNPKNDNAVEKLKILRQ